LGNGQTAIGRAAVVLCLFLLLLACIPFGIAHASPKTVPVNVVSTVSSAGCANPDSSTQWSCSVSVVEGSTIVVFVGCFSLDTSCQSIQLSVEDGDANSYAFAGSEGGLCSGGQCLETTYRTTTSGSGTDTLTFRTALKAFVAADIFVLTGVNSSVGPSKGGAGASNSGQNPSANVSPKPGGIVLAAMVIPTTEFPQTYTAGAAYTLIPGQPCSSCANAVGGWQAAELSDPASTTLTTASFATSPPVTDWEMFSLSFAPLQASTSVSCATPIIVAASTTAPHR